MMCASGPAWWAVRTRKRSHHRRTGGGPAAACVAAREEERCDRTRSLLCELANAAAADQSESLQQRRIRSITTAQAGRAAERDEKLERRALVAAALALAEIYDGGETQQAWRANDDVSECLGHGATDPLSRTWASGPQAGCKTRTSCCRPKRS